MAKTIVAILALLLVLVGPASAQEPEPSSEGTDPEPEPGADPQPGSDPSPGSENQTAEPAPSNPTASTTATGCRVAATHLMDPHISPTRWVIPDPDGCFRVLVERVLSPPASFVLRRLR